MSEDREENSWVEGRERILRRNETNQLRVQQARSLVVVVKKSRDQEKSLTSQVVEAGVIAEASRFWSEWVKGVRMESGQ